MVMVVCVKIWMCLHFLCTSLMDVLGKSLASPTSSRSISRAWSVIGVSMLGSCFRWSGSPCFSKQTMVSAVAENGYHLPCTSPIRSLASWAWESVGIKYQWLWIQIQHVGFWWLWLWQVPSSLLWWPLNIPVAKWCVIRLGIGKNRK